MTDLFYLALALTPAILALWAYRQGLRDGMAKAAGKPPERLASIPKLRREKPDPEAVRLNAILANVEAYDGTESGQKKVVTK